VIDVLSPSSLYLGLLLSFSYFILMQLAFFSKKIEDDKFSNYS